MNYGKAIENIRVNRMKQTQAFFAECIGTSQSYLSQVETGSRKPSLQLLEKIADYTDTPIPIMLWYSLTEDEIKQDYKPYYKILKPCIDRLVDCLI